MSTKSLSRISYDDLQKELDQRQQSIQDLHDERKELLGRLAEIDHSIFEITGNRPDRVSDEIHRKNRQRPVNSSTLLDTLKDVMTNKTMSVTEATEAARKAGYKSNSQNFKIVVNQTLVKYPDIFTKVERGFYRYDTPVTNGKKKTAINSTTKGIKRKSKAATARK